MKILLMGNPNVGKSVVFSRLTGSRVIASNYPGTTIEFTKGKVKFDGIEAELIDVPGVYSLHPVSKAEEVAIEMLEEGDLIINVVDATHLERNLYLTLQLIESGKPMIVALNMWDEAKHLGIEIDVEKLEKCLGVPVVPTVAITGEGIKRLVERLREAKSQKIKRNDEERWGEIMKIIREVQRIEHKHHTFLEKLSDTTLSPFSGIIIAFLVLFATFELVRFIGEKLITYIFDPFFQIYYLPIVERLSDILGEGILHKILIGELINGEIDFVQSMGLLTTGVYVPFAMVLPYVFAFYFSLGLLEDFGYLPRIAVLLDGILHKLGLHGSAVIPMLLSMGCNVPGVLATRILEDKRQRFIAASLMAICIPCMAQLAIIVSLVGRFGTIPLAIVFITLFSIWIFLGLILNKMLAGESPEIFLEVPPYRLPYYKVLVKKLWMRMLNFLKEAVPFVLLG
ncbi:MAG: ferrous iron transporter B, partial [Thermoplasmata archaeon]